MSTNDPFSGWDDSKGQPMVMVAPGGSSGGNRVTLILLIAALVFALGIAAYSMWSMAQGEKAHTAAVAETAKKHTAEVKGLEEKLVRATASLRDDQDYVAALEADNLALKNRQRPRALPAASARAPEVH